MDLFGGGEEDLDVDDEELMRELAEIQAISSSVSEKPARRSEPAGKNTKKGGGKQSIEQQLMGEIGSDIDDDDLEAELNALINADSSSNNGSSRKQPKNELLDSDSEEMPAKSNKPSTSASNRLSAVVPPVRSSSQTSVNSTASKQRDIHQPVKIDVVPPLPPRRTSEVLKEPVLQANPLAAMTIKASEPQNQPTSGNVDNRSKAKDLLLRRRDAFATNARLAVEDKNSDYAKECAETVMMFDQALEACEEQEITMDDLAEIPKTPPPYRKKQLAPKPGTLTLEQELQARIAKFQELATDFEQKSDTSRARMQRRLCSQLEDALKMHRRGKPIQPDILPVPMGFAKLPPSQTMPPSASNSHLSAPENLPSAGERRSANPSPARSESSPQMQAELLQAKALEYKKAALLAKKKGDLPAAAKYLQAAKAVEKEAENLNPSLAVPKPTFSGGNSSAEVQLTPASKLLVNLKHQLEMIMKLRTQFNAIKDMKRTLFYDELIKHCTKDLKICHHEVKSGHDALMKYKINELNLPTLEINPGMQADALELKIVSIRNLKMPEGWKPADAQTFVNFEFPFPHDAHQTGRSQIIYKTDSPEFNEAFQLKINRKTRQLQRICQRMPIKLSVYQKGGFLRSDKFCGEADVQFGGVCNQATLHIEQDLLDHRKKTGAQVSIEIRVQKPLDEKKMNTVKAYPWIRLIDSNSL